MFGSLNPKVIFTYTLVLLNYNSILYSRMTQSEAHLSVYNNVIQKYYNFARNPFYEKIYEQVVAKEKQYNDSHYVFYTGFSNEWRVPQDLYLKLYERLHPLTMNIDNFRAFRWMPIEHKTPKQLIKEEFIKHGLVDDTRPHLKAYLLSTNLALFGNVGMPDECTFEYFLNAKSRTKLSDVIYQSILDIYDNPAHYSDEQVPELYKYIPEISQLDDLLVADPLPNGKEPQSLAQIFIPFNIVDDVAYVAWVQGVPFENDLVNWIFEKAKKTRGKKKRVFSDIAKLFKDKQKRHPLFRKILNNIENGSFAISPVLNTYKNTPNLIPNLNYLQARLILTSKYMGALSSSVKVFTYDALSRAQKEKYEKSLNNIVDKIVEEFLRINALRKQKIR